MLDWSEVEHFPHAGHEENQAEDGSGDEDGPSAVGDRAGCQGTDPAVPDLRGSAAAVARPSFTITADPYPILSSPGNEMNWIV